MLIGQSYSLAAEQADSGRIKSYPEVTPQESKELFEKQAAAIYS
jgi:hypothetical protein